MGRIGRRTLRASAAVVLLGMLAVAGCGGPQQGGAEEEQTIRFAWWGDQSRDATTREVIAGFEAKHPNITVQGETSDFQAYFDRLATQTAARDAPDVMTLGGAYPREYSDRGALLDLESVPEQLDLSGFPQATLESARFDGTLYGAPTGGNAIGVLLNPDLFEAAGVEVPDADSWTWQEFADAAAAVTAGSPDGSYGYEPFVNDVIGVYAQQRGPAIYGPDGGVSVEAATAEDWWTFELEMLESGAIPPASVIQETAAVSPEQSLTGQGRAAMTITYSNLLATYSEAAGSELQLLPVPGESEFANAGTTVLPSQYYAISSQSEHQEAAALLIDHLLTDPAAGALIRDDRGFPFDRQVVEAITPELDRYGQANGEFLEQVATNGAPPVAVPPAGATALNDVTARLDSDVLFGRTTPAEASVAWVEQLQQAVEQAR